MVNPSITQKQGLGMLDEPKRTETTQTKENMGFSEQVKDQLLLISLAKYLSEECSMFSDIECFHDRSAVNAAVQQFNVSLIGYKGPPYDPFMPLGQKAKICSGQLNNLYHELRTLHENGVGDKNKLDYFLGAFKNAGFEISQNKLSTNAATGTSSLGFFTFEYDVLPIEGMYCKLTEDSTKLDREVFLARCLEWYGVDVLKTSLLTALDGKLYSYSESTIQPPAESAIRMEMFLQDEEYNILRSLAKLHVRGTFALDTNMKDYLEKWHSEHKEARKLGRELGGARLQQAIREGLEYAATYHLQGNLRDLTSECPEQKSSTQVNYISETARRFTRIRIDPAKSEFYKKLVSEYIRPIMKYRVLSHNDFHAANVFCNGKIFDLENSAGFATLGEDLAQFLISEYALAPEPAQKIKEKHSIKEIIEEKKEPIEYFISCYNTEIKELKASSDFASAQSYDGLQNITVEQFTKHFEKVMAYTAFTVALQRLNSYTVTNDKKHLDYARKSFELFYNSIGGEERKLFKKEFNCTALSDFCK